MIEKKNIFNVQFVCLAQHILYSSKYKNVVKSFFDDSKNLNFLKSKTSLW